MYLFQLGNILFRPQDRTSGTDRDRGTNCGPIGPLFKISSGFLFLYIHPQLRPSLEPLLEQLWSTVSTTAPAGG